MTCINRCFVLMGFCLLAACSAGQKYTLVLVEASISDIQDAVRSGEVSCRDVV